MTGQLQQYAARAAERDPDGIALVLGEERLTFGEVEHSSNQLARLLQETGCGRGDRVCLFVPKSPAAVVGMLAALKAGCAYVPIDIASPAARVEMILRASQPRVLLTAAPAAGLVDALFEAGAIPPDVTVGSVERASIAGERFASAFAGRDLEQMDASPLGETGSADDLAHILFTSGSTGVPKGVMISHANVTRFIEWATRYFGITASDRLSGHPPLHFDLSTFDIYGALCAGAELHLVAGSASLLPHAVARLIRDAELTQWFSVPSAMAYMTKFDVIAEGDFPSLRRVIWCGEVLPTPVLIHWMRRVPHARFTNLYGPTEATIASSFYTVSACPEDETQQIPIGTACDGEELLVLDGDLQPVATGSTGDLWIGGAGVSPGYWRDPERTRAAFVADPRGADPGARIYRTGDLARIGDDGLVYFLGRADSQIKSRGYRIELGEIETALNALEAVSECAVVGVETSAFEGTSICCAYAPHGDAGVEPAQLRTELQKVLPSYMLPSRWLSFRALPKNVNGKIDRARLREAFREER